MEPAAYYKNPRSSEPDSPVSAQRSAPTPVSARALLTRMLCRNLLTAAIGKRIAVGMPIAGHPPHRSGQARFGHPALTLGVYRRSADRARDEEYAAREASRRPVSSFGAT